jgi:hypothetical protein
VLDWQGFSCVWGLTGFWQLLSEDKALVAGRGLDPTHRKVRDGWGTRAFVLWIQH